MESIAFSDYVNWPQMNASTLVHGVKSMRQLKYVRDNGYQPKTDTRVGTALHSLAECLPVDRFDEMFVVMPDYKLSPDNVTSTGKSSTSKTSWVREQESAFLAEHEGAEAMSVAESRRCKRMLYAIQRNKEAMELIEKSAVEVSLLSQLYGVECKGRLDGVDMGDNSFWDIKTTRNASSQPFGKTAANLHYLFKMAFYWLLLQRHGMEAAAVKFIAIQDSVPLGDGSFNEAADCAVYDIPLIALENQIPEIERLLSEYTRCLADDVWPGIPNGPLHIPNWSMNETELVA